MVPFSVNGFGFRYFQIERLGQNEIYFFKESSITDLQENVPVLEVFKFSPCSKFFIELKI